MQVARTSQPALAREKGQCHQSRSRDRKMRESQGKREPHLGEKKKVEDSQSVGQSHHWMADSQEEIEGKQKEPPCEVKKKG